MANVSIDYIGEAALVKLNRGVTNALNLECVSELDKILEQIENAPTVRGLVLSSSNDKFFSIGFDIPQLYHLDKADFQKFYRAFNRACMHLFTLSKPTVAAITGHAIAGGTILALCCDYRFIADGRKLMGLNEVKLGVPVPYLANCILHSLVGTRHAREIREGGEFLSPEESLEVGLVDQILPQEHVVDAAIEKAQFLGSMPSLAFGLIKQNRTKGIEAQISEHGEEKSKSFIECWYSNEARQLLREAMHKF